MNFGSVSKMSRLDVGGGKREAVGAPGHVLGFELWRWLNYNHGVPDEFASPINASTRICAVYGFPIRHSASPAMQNAGIAALGLNWRYIACEVAPETLRAAIEGAKTMRFVGLNLTVPHKLLAVDFVDAFDSNAS